MDVSSIVRRISDTKISICDILVSAIKNETKTIYKKGKKCTVDEIDKLHNVVGGIHAVNIGKQGQPFVKCLGNQKYFYDYPICWFRSVFYIMFLDRNFNDLLVKAVGRGSDSIPLERIRQYIIAVSHHIRSVDYDNKEHTYAFYKGMDGVEVKVDGVEGGNKKVYFTMEHFVLYLLHLLYEYNKLMFPVNSLCAYTARQYPLRFFRNVFPMLMDSKSEISYEMITVSNNTNVFKGVKDYTVHYNPKEEDSNPKEEDSNLKEEDSNLKVYRKNAKSQNPSFIILDYGTALKNLFSKTNDLALFIERNGQYYYLSSFSLASELKLSDGHILGIFNCKGRYYASEYPYNKGDNRSGILGFKDTKLIEKILLGRTNRISEGFYESLGKIRYDVNKCCRVGVYLPLELGNYNPIAFTPQEVPLLHSIITHLKSGKASANIPTAYDTFLSLLCFLNSFTITLSLYTTGIGSSQIVPASFTITVECVEGLAKCDNDTIIIDQTYTCKKDDKETVFTLTKFAKAGTGNMEFMYVNAGSHNLDDGKLPHELKDILTGLLNELNTLFNGMRISHVEMTPLKMTKKYVYMETLQNLFKMLYEKNEGGQMGGKGTGDGSRTSVRYNKKTYKVYKSKNKKKFINVKKQRVYLCDIKGKYRYLRPTV